MSISRFLSFFSTFINEGQSETAASLPATLLASGAAVTATTNLEMPSASSIPIVKVKFDGFETFWREGETSTLLGDPESAASINWYYGVYYKISGTTLTLNSFMYNNQLTPQTSTDITVRYKVQYFVAPF